VPLRGSPLPVTDTALSLRVEALAPAQGEARLDRELIVRSETCDAHVASSALSLVRGEDAPLSDLWVVLRVAPAADALKVERLREDAALALRLALRAHVLALRWRDVDLADGWLYVGRAKKDAGIRRIKIRPALRDVLLDLKANATAAGPDALVFATASGKPHAQSNVRRTMTNVVALANERLEEAGPAPLPRLSPHALRRTWASVMFALGESIPIVMAEGGWADPQVALTVYAHAMRRDDAENEALRALVEGSPIGSSGSGAASAPTADRVEIAS